MSDNRTISVPVDYLKSLERKVQDLNTLLELSSLISSTLEFNDLMGLVIEKARQEMGADASSILLYNRETEKLEFEVVLSEEQNSAELLKKKVTLDLGQGIAGWVAQNLKPLVIEDVSKDSRFFAEADKITGFQTKSLIAIPLVGRSGLIGVAEVINPTRSYDLELFKMLCRQFAIAIENALYHKESLAQERLKQELEIAASVQKSFLPDLPFLSKGNITMSATNIPAAQVGGDLYDFIELSDGRIGILIGDVSGKGISAALFMAKAISDFRHVVHLAESPGHLLQLLNAMLSRAPHGMFMTALYLVADTSTGKIEAALAGHPPPLLVRGDAVTTMDIPAGPPLGILETEYSDSSFLLNGGDRLLLFTDGCFEARDRNGRRTDFHMFLRFVKEHCTEQQLTNRVVDFVHDFSEGTALADDLTIIEIVHQEQ